MDPVNKPCVECSEPVLVHPYASGKFVKCPAHKGLTAIKKIKGRRSVLNPFDLGITMEERQLRAVGAVVTLFRKIESVSWREEITLASIDEFDEVYGTVKCFAQGGSVFQPPYDPRRERGQCRAFELSEVVSVR